MRTHSLILCYLVLISILTACHGHYYQKDHELPKEEWEKDYAVEFKVDVDDFTAKYDLHVRLAYLARVVPANVQIQMRLETPSGANVSYLYTIPLKTEEGEQLGDIAGDYGEIEYTIEESFEFNETGTFLFKFLQDASHEPVHGITSVGMTINQQE